MKIDFIIKAAFLASIGVGFVSAQAEQGELALSTDEIDAFKIAESEGRDFIESSTAIESTARYNREPAAKKSAKPPKKKAQYISGESLSSGSRGGGADSTEGWIIKRTKDGKIIKIPKKQTFKFGGSQVSGEANRPNETLLGNRLTPREATLIPERKSYRSEFLESAGYSERTRK